MMRAAVLGGLLAWVGLALLLSELRWFSRPSLIDRLRPHAKGPMAASAARLDSLAVAEDGTTRVRPAPRAGPVRAGRVLSVASLHDVLAPLAQTIGERMARLFGISEGLSVRLARIHSRLDPAGFRLRQFGWLGAGLSTGLVGATTLKPPLAIGALLVLGLPVLGFLIAEQRLSAASAAWQQRVTLELPVVSEQLAMLLAAGYSLGAALNRLAERSSGACAQDLAIVSNRVRQGLTEIEALREWAAVVRVDAVDRLIPVLALNTETSDLGRLVSDEARAIRRDVQRDTIATMERRAQQVWVPVTIATLVPGVILLAVPFLQALRLFSGS